MANTRHYSHLIISLCPVYCSTVENGDAADVGVLRTATLFAIGRRNGPGKDVWRRAQPRLHVRFTRNNKLAPA